MRYVGRIDVICTLNEWSFIKDEKGRHFVDRKLCPRQATQVSLQLP